MNADKRSNDAGNGAVNDDWARRVLTEAVGDVEPTDRLADIRQRTVQRRRRPTWPVVGGVVLATAAAVTAIAVLGNRQAPVTEPEPLPPTTTEPTDAPTPTAPATGQQVRALPVYYLGTGPGGPVLFREWQRNVDDTDPVMAAVQAAIAGEPQDPDYRSGWPDGAEVRSVGVTPDLITVDLAGDLHDRPAGMAEDNADLAIQQVVYTAQAAYGQGRVPVQLLLDGGHSDQILGVPASEPLANAPAFETLSLVSIDTPTEGEAVAGGTLEASGVASSFEANVPWHVLDADGNRVLEGFATAEGWMDRLYPWRTEIDVSGLDPGEYTFVAQTEDPSGGAEGAGPHTDTRTFVVR